MAKLKISAKSGNAAGFSNIPGSTNYALSFGKQFVGGFKKGQKLGGPKPGKPKGTKPEGETITDTAPDTDGEPTKPKKDKERQATIADVETAVRKGYITPEEGGGTGVQEKWYETNDDGTPNYKKRAKTGISKNYGAKLGRAQAESQATGKPLGKQFTGPEPGRDTAPIWDTPESKGNSNRGKQFPSL